MLDPLSPANESGVDSRGFAAIRSSRAERPIHLAQAAMSADMITASPWD
jgi:hypothetical protein